MSDTASLQDAAVLVPLYRDQENELRLVVLRRAEGGLHGGQLAFPGGKPEPGDASRRATAIRETCEETGLTPDAIEIVADLEIIETRSTGFRIAPFLGRIRPPARWNPQAAEVAEILEVRVRDLLEPGAHDSVIETFPNWPGPHRISFYHIGPHRLWGASYRIFHPLLPRIAAGEWDI